MASTPVVKIYSAPESAMDEYIQTMLDQQKEYLNRTRKKPFNIDSPFVGVPKVVYAVNEEEAFALQEYYEDKFKDKHGVSTGRCHQIVRR